MTPVRMQLSRKKGFNLQEASIKLNGLQCVNVARPGRYGNPHNIGMCPVCGVEHTRDEAVAEYEAGVMQNLWALGCVLAPLRGKNLACWCRADEKCHADVLLRLANMRKIFKTSRGLPDSGTHGPSNPTATPSDKESL